jgi:hypothetical protein
MGLKLREKISTRNIDFEPFPVMIEMRWFMLQICPLPELELLESKELL